jgi:hypothetical protein
LWPAGDTFMVYPGGHSSIRFEKLREGIVDYEKIRLLRDRVAAGAVDPATREHLSDLERRLGAIDAEQAFDKQELQRDLAGAARVLAALSDRLVP